MRFVFLLVLFIFLMIRRPPRSTLFSLHDALPIFAGTDTYTLTTIGNTSVFDVVGIALTYGSQRVILNHLSYTDLTARYRAWTSYRGTPECWARYGPASIVF